MPSLSDLKILIDSYSGTYIKESLIPKEYLPLWLELEEYGKRERIPSISLDVGALISFFITLKRPKVIFEFGSGVGHSAFWYFIKNHDFIEKVYLTEKRETLWNDFKKFPWPSSWLDKIVYHQGDAFDLFPNTKTPDFIFMDGQKGMYLPFFQMAEKKLSENGLIMIDNTFWKGNVLDEEKKSQYQIKEMSFLSAKGINDFNEYIKNHPWNKTFLPIDDGVTLLHP